MKSKFIFNKNSFDDFLHIPLLLLVSHKNQLYPVDSHFFLDTF